MKQYRTAEVAALAGIHPNTVRLYEQWGLIPKPKRKENGYRVFNELHVQQIQLVRTAFQIEIVQLEKEHDNAEEAIRIVRHILSGWKQEGRRSMKRKDVSVYLGISMDTLRNWEMNGLLTVKRKENGYRIYTDNDIKRLKIIRSLRCANYSLEAILLPIFALHSIRQTMMTLFLSALGCLFPSLPQKRTPIRSWICWKK